MNIYNLYYPCSKFQYKTVRYFILRVTIICFLSFSPQASATDYISTVNGSIPARILQGGDTVTVSGNGTRALYANGAGQSIVVQNGGATFTNLSFLGGFGIVTANSGGVIDLGTGSVINVEGSGIGPYMGPTGFFVNGVDSIGNAQNLRVNASGDKPYGVHARNGGTINLTGTTSISLAANAISESAFGLVAGWSTPTSESIITAENLIIIGVDYNGSLGYLTGILSNNNTTTTISGLTKIGLAGKQVEGISISSGNGDFGAVSMNDIDATVTASNGGAGFAIGLSSHYGLMNESGNARFNIFSDGKGVGIYLDEHGKVDLTGTSQFSINAPGAYGILAEGTSGTVTANNIVMDVIGTTDASVISSEVSAANVSNSVQINNGVLNSNMDGISVKGGTLNVSLTDTAMSNGSGIAFKVGPSAANIYRGDLELIASNSILSGAATLVTGSVSSIMLNNKSSWAITGDSVLTSLTNNNSIVAFAFPSKGAFKTLTVDNYSGMGGTLTLNTALGGDTSPSDLLVINGGTATGSTLLSVINAGGLGEQTVEGIQIIDVTGTSTDTAFVQGSRIVAGAYEYSLMKGSASGLNPESWYLTSKYIATIPNGNKKQENIYIMRPEIGAYISNLAAANTLFATRLHDRLGETQYTDYLTGETKITSMWIRQEGGHNRSRTQSGQTKTQSNRYVVQIGGDIAQWSGNGLDRLHLGAMAGYGRVEGNSKAKYTANNAKNKVDGYALGLYSTWYANKVDKSGLYVDSWMQYAWFDNNVQGDGLAKENYDSQGWLTSVETGYSFKIGENERTSYWLQPKVQLTWMDIHADKHYEANKTKITGSGNNLSTRLGLRAYAQGHSEVDVHTVRIFQPFVEVNWIYNNKNFGVTMNDTSDYQAGTRNIGELKVGVEGHLNKNLNIWGSVTQQVGGEGYNDTQAILGLKWCF